MRNLNTVHVVEDFQSMFADAPWLRRASIVIAGSLFVALCAQISLPLYFTPVPLTLQPFAVLLIGLLLSPSLAAGTMAAYLAEGAVGMPVFSPTATALSGFAHLFGPTGGYLLSYPVAAFAISYLWRLRQNRGFAMALVSAAVGNLVILSIGALWLAVLTHASFQAVSTQAIIPFLPGDALKIAAAASLAAGWQRTRRKNNSIPSTN